MVVRSSHRIRFVYKKNMIKKINPRFSQIYQNLIKGNMNKLTALFERLSNIYYFVYLKSKKTIL